MTWTLRLTKIRNIQTNINFGQKMSVVQPLFQALQGMECSYVASYSISIPYSRKILRAPIFEDFLLTSKILSSKFLAAIAID